MDRESDRIEREAADWLARRDGDLWTEADEAAFLAWQRQSTAHRVAAVRLKTVWQHADRLQALGAGVAKGEVPDVGLWRRSLFAVRTGLPRMEGRTGNGARFTQADPASRLRIMRRRRGMVAVAASLVFALGLGGLWSWRMQMTEAYSTAIGGLQAVPLDDGSQMVLNTDSYLRLAWGAHERRMELKRGEAYFEVAKDPARPFVVETGSKRVVAVGTRFSVRREGDDKSRVVVTEGRVRIEEKDRRNRVPPTQVGAGELAYAGAAGVVVNKTDVARAEAQLTWRSGYLAFDDTPLSEAVAEFNRYNRRQVIIADPVLGELRIGGNLRTTNVEEFVRVMERGFPVQATVQEERIVLTSR